MPRIDPERLLKCLAPLLDPNSGAIRSTEEVDKILGLMSKFSKKLVSKCIYINILRATDAGVVDLFMERGGWNLVFGWTNDAISNNNYSLLQEIFELLLRTPVSIPRLKSNRFPIVVKNFSKVCEDETTKNLCKQLVHRWITVAKAEEKTEQAPPPLPPPSVSQAELLSSISGVGATPSRTGVGDGGGELPNLSNMNADHLLNIDPASLPLIPDADVNHQNLMDLDLTNSELAALDFNLDIYNFGGDTHSLVEEAMAGGGVPTQPPHQQMQQPPTQIIGGGEMIGGAAPISVIQHAPAPLQQMQQPQLIQQQGIPQQQSHHIILEQHIQAPPQAMQQQQIHHQIIQQPQQIHPQQILIPAGAISTTSNVILTNANTITHAPHIMHPQPPQPIQIIHQQQPPPPPQQVVVPTMVNSNNDPQQQQQQQMISLLQMPAPPKLVIKSMGGQRAVVQNLPTDSGQYCLMVKDGKNYLVRLKEPGVVMTNPGNPVTSMVVQAPPPPVQQQLQPPPQQQHLPPPPPVVVGNSGGVVMQDPGNNRVPPLIIRRDSPDTPDGGAVLVGKKARSPKLVEPQVVSPVNKVPGDMKTYSKTKSSSSSSSSGSSKDKKEHHHKSSSSSSSSSSKSKSSSDSHSSSSSSSSSHHHRKSKKESAANKAAAAAAQAKEEERLREKIRREKAQMKKRQKEQDKQKQQTEKDQETLKKLNLIPGSGTSTTSGSSSSSSPGSLKIPKIPRRSNSSFADAIGIPGTDGGSGVDKIKKVSSSSSSSSDKSKEPSKDGKEKGSESSAPGSVSTSPVKKFYGRNEEEAAEDEKPKERRHKVKVFVSSKSRSDDLLKEMTESGGAKKTSKEKDAKDKEKEDKEAGNKGSGLTLGNSIPATPPKITKRLSTDSLEKPGDMKKPRLDGKDKPKESVKDKIRKTVAASLTLKESSLFMDAISAGADTTKPAKKKRRPSSGGEGGKEGSKDMAPGEGLPGAEEPSTPVLVEREEPVKKPVFNFYRDTLNDEDDAEEVSVGEAKKEVEEEQPEKKEEVAAEEAGSFTPQEGDGKVKSALVLVRARNRPRKTVRWREEDELREFHFFEMDETERVNVTKQKDFTDLTNNEKAIEGSFLKRMAEETEQEKNKQWRMKKIWFTTTILNPPIISTEVVTQEEREKNVLGLFLPPGSILPDTAIEAEAPPNMGEKPEAKMIPVEDVNGITKVCDYRTHQWPDPVGGQGYGNMGAMMMGRGGGAAGGYGMHQQQQQQQHHARHHNQRNPMEGLNHPPQPQFPLQNHMANQRQFPPQMVPHPTSSPTQMPPPQQQDYNPWNANLGFNVPPPSVPPPVVAPDLGAFGQFGGAAPAAAVAAAAMNMMAQAPPQLPFQNPFAFPPPPNPLMNGTMGGVVDYGAGNAGAGPRGNEASNHHHRGGQGSSRFEGNDRRNNFSGGRDNSRSDRDRSNSRDRDFREDRSGRDRDYRRGSDRDYRNNQDRGSNDRNNRDYRRGESGNGGGSGGGRNIRKEIPCRFFKKGFCGNGSRCEFLHEGPSERSSSSRRSPPSDQTDNHVHQQSPPFDNNIKDDDWETPSSHHIPDSAQSPPQEEQTVNPNHMPRMTSRFSDAPMSPTEESPTSPPFGGPGGGGGPGTGGTSETKVIPV